VFYVAVHEAQALLLARGHTPRDHKQRNFLLKNNWPSTVWPPYESLQQSSNRARYRLWTPKEDDLKKALLTLAKLRAEVALVGPPP
jgi:hypothetical protein